MWPPTIASEYAMRAISISFVSPIRGTRNVLDAAAEHGVQRIVHTSSVCTLGLTDSVHPNDEKTPVVFGDMIGAYKKSKFRAEQIAVQLAARGAPIVIVNPSTPIGPRDIKPTPTGRVILEAAKGRMPAYVNTGLNIVHVDDVANGHLLAADRGQFGERYILGGQNLSLKVILHAIAVLTGHWPPLTRLPRRALFPYRASD